MAIILVDQDGVLADFEGGFLRLWRERHPDLPYVPLVDRRTFLIEDQYPAEHLGLVREIQNARGFFLGFQPIPGALAALREMLAAGHEVFICTSPISANPWCAPEKYEWVERHLPPPWKKRVILTADKTLVHGDYLIDDKPKITGCRRPDWRHVVFDQPYNRHVVDRPRLSDWRDWRFVLDR